MHYVIYPDTLFMEHLVCNLLFLTFFKNLFFPHTTWKRILIAGASGALCNTLVSILFFKSLWILQTGVMLPAAGAMMLYCANLKDIKRILYLWYQMIVWILVLGGILQVLQQCFRVHTLELIVTVALFGAVFLILERFFRVFERQSACMREVILYFHGKSCRFEGFADTGNQLFDPVTKKPVSIITVDAWNTLAENAEEPAYRFIPYQSVGNPSGILPGVQIDRMVVTAGADSRIYEKPMIAITKQPFAGIFHYSILLHNEYCQGGK